jgi:hypothetical protein
LSNIAKILLATATFAIMIAVKFKSISTTFASGKQRGQVLTG